jgi:transposase-like protein
MALVHVQCPHCHSIDVVQYGQQANGTQRYRCNNPDCPRTIFLLQYHDKGRLPAVKQQRLLLDSRVVDVPRSSNPMVVILSSSKPLFFNGFQQRGVLLGL